MCSHEQQCPSAGHTARVAAHVIAGHPEQGWSLLCNRVVVFEDTGGLLPDGSVIEADRTRWQPGAPEIMPAGHAPPVAPGAREGGLRWRGPHPTLAVER